MNVWREAGQFFRHALVVALCATAGMFVVGPSIALRIAAWAIIFYPVLVLLWWFARTPYRFHAPEPAVKDRQPAQAELVPDRSTKGASQASTRRQERRPAAQPPA